MKRYLSFILLLAGLTAHAQVANLIGSVQDTASQPMANVSVMLLQANDSVLTSFGLSSQKGQFRLINVPPGEYLLQFSYLGFARLWEPVSVKDKGQIEIGTFTMQPEDLVLDAVDIEAERSPMSVRKDTIEYNADMFSPQPGENVEDLLKRLPGVEVERDGSVKAQGEQVQRVLVDGKEFFGDDPQIATRNLPADALDKVQVFDKKTDQEEFTGVDDGRREQTINLTLKEDRKSGVFGEIEAGYGTEQRYKVGGSLNRFSPGTQISLLGMGNNVNDAGFSFEDYLQFMGGLSALADGGGGSIRLEIGDDSGIPISGGAADGFVNTLATGLNLNQDLGRRSRISGNYFFSNISRELAQDIYRQQFLNGSFFESNQSGLATSSFLNHRLNSTYRFKGDSLSRFSLSANLGWNDGGRFDSTFRETFGGEGNLENGIDRRFENEGQKINGRINADFQRRLRKKGRTLSLNATVNGQMQDRLGVLQSYNTVYPVITTPVTDSIQQEQTQDNEQMSYEVEASYTEPLPGKNFLKIAYEHGNATDLIDQGVFDLLPERMENMMLSNRYRRGYVYNQTGLRFTHNGDKLNLQMGLNAQRANLDGQLFSLNDSIQRRFDNLFPSFRVAYDLASARRISLNYRTSLSAPTLTQLQPVIDNRDPFNVYIGNPDLQAAYRHTAGLNFSHYDQFNFLSLFAFINATYTQNPIVEARTIDSLFRQVRRPVNVDEALQINGTVFFGAPIRPLKMKVNINAGWRFNQSQAFINEVINDVNRMVSTIDIRLENRKKEKIDIAVGADFSFNQARYSRATNLNQNFLNQRYYADLRWNLGENWRFNTSLDWAIFGGDLFEEQQQVPLWQASLSRFLWNKKLRLELSAFDLLNQNQGVRRQAELTYLEEVRTQTLSRYFMLGLTYSIKTGAKAPKPSIHIDRR